jgi:hypothetical protein
MDFWPASSIKLYAAIAALELLHEQGHGLHNTTIFEQQDSRHLSARLRPHHA